MQKNFEDKEVHESSHRNKTQVEIEKNEVVKLHREEGKILSAISAKSFEDKEVQENAQRSKTQVEIEKLRL